MSLSPHSPFYAHLYRLRFIKRWGLMRNAVEEDVAQHSWDVAVLAHALAVIRRDVLGLSANPDAVAAKAVVEVPITPAAAARAAIKETLTTWTTVLPPVAKTKAALLQALPIEGPIKITWAHLPISMPKTHMLWNRSWSITGAMLIMHLWSQVSSPALLATAALLSRTEKD